jgi:hypothetical protein
MPAAVYPHGVWLKDSQEQLADMCSCIRISYRRSAWHLLFCHMAFPLVLCIAMCLVLVSRWTGGRD